MACSKSSLEATSVVLRLRLIRVRLRDLEYQKQLICHLNVAESDVWRHPMLVHLGSIFWSNLLENIFFFAQPPAALTTIRNEF